MSTNGVLRRVGYVSLARHPLGDESDRDILLVSRELNAGAEVTGFLFRTGRHFIQVLEGRDRPVMETMERIRRDERHFDMREWTPEWVGNRVFADWDMGYFATAEDEMFAFALYRDKDDPPTETIMTLRAMSETFS
ncbi:MAG: BLUF domain-containing protein [Silicimonas sp.]|nr:BLUF domain-containing protein [Silicimonas sp.]